MKYGTTLVLMFGVLSMALHGCGDGGGRQNLSGSRNVAAAPTESLVVTDWGPRETVQGVVFNQQPTGKSALWIMVAGVREHPDTQITFGGKPMEDIAITASVVTGAVSKSYIETPGPKEIVVAEGGTGRKVVVGNFLVKPKAEK
jgi:hypothetical protein